MSHRVEDGIVQAGSAEDVRKWVLALSNDTGLSVSDLAKRAGLQPSTLTRFLKGSVDGAMLSGRTLQKLNIIGDRILREMAQPEEPAKAWSPPAVIEDRSVFQGHDAGPMPLLQLELASVDILGPEGIGQLEIVRNSAFPQSGEPWPIASGPNDRRFAIYMPGEFMRPRFRAGECLIVDRVRPPAVGGDVLVEFVPEAGEPTLGTIAELLGRDRSQAQFRQVQNQVSATIHSKLIRRIFAIIGAFAGDVGELGLNLGRWN